MPHNWIPVASNHVSAVSYDPDIHEVRIMFDDGSVYAYYDVPQEVFDELLSHPSKGRFVNIKLRREFSYGRVS